MAFVAVTAVLAVGAGMFGMWQMADHWVFRALHVRGTPVPGDSIRLIDIEYPDDARRGQQVGYRRIVESALRQLAEMPSPPRTVLLDIWISNNPEGAEAVAAGIAALRAKGTRVYAAVEPKDRHGRLTGDFMKAHNEAIYSSALDGYGHTQLDYGFGVLKYERELALPGALGETHLTALPVRAALDPERSEALPPALIVPLGEDSAFKPYTHRLAGAGSRLEPPLPPDAAPAYAIVGSLAEDSDNLLKRPGPLLLAWALSDLTAGRASLAREPLNHPAALAGLAALGALCSWGAFQLAFHGARRRVTPPRWHALAAITSVGAFFASVAALLSIGSIVLFAGRVVPVAFPITCAALAAGFAWLGARDWIADERIRRDLSERPEAPATHYDVFVSYAHDPADNKAWVRKEIVEPLAALRHADGSPYRVFFDDSSIKVGKRWKAEIELALLGARCFVPVYSERYFERPYCREEIEIADQLRVEGRLRMYPVARTVENIPELYLRKVQYLDARNNPGFIETLIAEVQRHDDEHHGLPARGWPVE